MQSLKITQRGLGWLTQTESFRVLHQFENVCNLINQSNQILAIHTADIGMGPFSCQIERSRFQQIISADSIKLDPTNATFSIGNHSFSTKDCALWNARPNWISFDYSTAVDIEHQLSDGVQERTWTLHQAILANDQTTLKNEVGQLAGRGIGLTPEGDDVLLGTIYALHILGWDPTIIQMIGEATVGRTTSLSAAFLQAAVAGEATEHWHDVISKKAGALERLLAVGATSGKDGWYGLTTGLQVLSQRNKY